MTVNQCQAANSSGKRANIIHTVFWNCLERCKFSHLLVCAMYLRMKNIFSKRSVYQFPTQGNLEYNLYAIVGLPDSPNVKNNWVIQADIKANIPQIGCFLPQKNFLKPVKTFADTCFETQDVFWFISSQIKKIHRVKQSLQKLASRR